MKTKAQALTATIGQEVMMHAHDTATKTTTGATLHITAISGRRQLKGAIQ